METPNRSGADRPRCGRSTYHEEASPGGSAGPTASLRAYLVADELVRRDTILTRGAEVPCRGGVKVRKRELAGMLLAVALWSLREGRAVGNGEAIFSPGVATKLANFFAEARPAPVPREAFPELSEREREILDLMTRGLKNPEIARRLYLSPKTVRNHVSNIFTKLQVSDRTQAIVRAREQDWEARDYNRKRGAGSRGCASHYCIPG